MIWYLTTLDQKETVSIPVYDILYFDLWRPRFSSKQKSRIRCVTAKGEYLFKFVGDLEDVAELFEQFGFYPIDSVNVVNMNKIIYVDEDRKCVFFDNNRHASYADVRKDLLKYFPRKT